MRLLVALALLAAVAACSSRAEPAARPARAGATSSLPSCEQTWKLAAKITRAAAAESCVDIVGERFTPTVLRCDPALRDGVESQLVLGPVGAYVLFMADETLGEVDNGTGTGDYRDDASAPVQEVACIG